MSKVKNIQINRFNGAVSFELIWGKEHICFSTGPIFRGLQLSEKIERHLKSNLLRKEPKAQREKKALPDGAEGE